MRAAKKEITRLMACKIDGICERDAIVSEYLRAGMVSWKAGRAAMVEGLRCRMELPPCPPLCLDGEVIVVDVDVDKTTIV
jgi:hypothetical protein